MKRSPPGDRPLLTADGYRREMIALLRQNCDRHDMYTVWTDFIEMSALAIANSVDRAQRTEREARYMAIVGRYKPEQACRFGQALGALTMAMEVAAFDDVLGTAFMELELGNKWAGQFFTPYHLCQLMARVNVAAGVTDALKERGFVTVNDPACGAGALPIAMAQALLDAGHNYQHCMHLTAQDVDSRAVHMAYIQFSLLHIPAVVILGNTLANECREAWYTPAHVLGGWQWKLARSANAPVPAIEAVAPAILKPEKRKETHAQPQLAGLFD